MTVLELLEVLYTDGPFLLATDWRLFREYFICLTLIENKTFRSCIYCCVSTKDTIFQSVSRMGSSWRLSLSTGIASMVLFGVSVKFAVRRRWQLKPFCHLIPRFFNRQICLKTVTVSSEVIQNSERELICLYSVFMLAVKRNGVHAKLVSMLTPMFRWHTGDLTCAVMSY